MEQLSFCRPCSAYQLRKPLNIRCRKTMAKSLSSSFSSLFFFFLIPFISANPNANKSSSQLSLAHTELTKYGFPIGLLPNNVHTYTVNSTSGEFSVHLGYNCRVTLPPDNYLATYSKQITGKIVENRIADLNGINVRAFFRWWGLTGVRSNGKDLVFEVGMVTAKYPSKNFNESLSCEGKHSSS